MKKNNIKLTILYLDDERDELEVTKKYIEMLEHKCLIAQRIEDALSLVKENKIDIVILDFHLLGTGSNGILVANEINKIAPTIPILIITQSDNDFIKIMELKTIEDVKILGFCPKKKLDLNLEGWLDVVIRNKNNENLIFKWGIIN